MSVALKPEFLLDERGRKTAEVMDLRSFRRLKACFEDTEDRQQVLSLKQRALNLRPHEQFRRELQGQGLNFAP
ncbi:hypothetical protein IT575_05360 [bacterium]|nr:hypothetical protein [bacterium]